MNTIRKFFRDGFYPFESMKSTRKTIIAEKQLNKYPGKIDKNCPQDGAPLSDMICNQLNILETLSAEQAFEIGFSLGVRLTADSYRNT